MSDLKFTPGPWFMIDNSGPYLLDDGESVIGTYDIANTESLLDKGYKKISSAYTYGGKPFPSVEQAKYNAKLMAAAPCMLAALQASIELADKNLSDNDGVRTEGCQAVYDQVKAAINKATV